MSPFGHLATTYIIAFAFSFIFNVQMNWYELILILIFANIIDFDYLIGRIFGKKGEAHHGFITHTPFGVFILWLIFAFTVFYNSSVEIKVLLLITMMIHLVLDEIQYILYRAGIQPDTPHKQINWLYPIQKHKPKQLERKKAKEIAQKMKPLLISESVIILIAILLFMWNLVG